MKNPTHRAKAGTTHRWPYPDITAMHAHRPSGQWRRRYKGRDYYFGVMSDPKAALARWRAVWPLVTSGKPVVVERSDPAVGIEAACEAFLSAKLAALERGELVKDSFTDYRQECRRLCAAIGFDTPLRMIGPSDFDAIMAGMAKLSPITRGARVVKVRTIFRWIAGRYDIPIKVPDDFCGPPMRVRREERAKRRHRTFKPDEIHRMLKLASPVLRACIMLGINGGYGPSDIAATRTEHLDLAAKMIDHTRGKTGAERKVPLWPETLAALRPVMDKRRDLLLVWPDNGLALVRPGCRDLARAMKPIRQAAGVVGEFKWLRYTFATVAAQTGDDHARKIIEGHVVDGVAENYVLEFPVKRLRAVTDHVHRWLYR